MSAIWGAINLEMEEIPEGFAAIFHQAYRDCVIDKTASFTERNVLLGCEHQFFTEQARREQLPRKGEDGSCFVADVYLENREELLKDAIFAGNVKARLTAEDETKADEMPDGEILFRFFQKYGKSRLGEVRGSYAFVHYDAKSNVVSIVTDHLANRCLYYAVIDQVLYFSTLMEPIVTLNRDKLHANQKVLQDFMAIPDVRVYLDHEATVFFEIRHVAAGEILEITGGDTYATKYWEPLKDWKPFRNKTDEEYRREFREIFDRSVRSCLRTQESIGIFLSGGLDSTAVACVAAGQLKEQGKKLHAYTMIPTVGYQDDTGERVNVDERALVHATAMHLGNVEEHYESLDQINAWDCMEEQIRLLEGPFKSMQNVMMLGELGKLAREDGCRIVLNGQLGNDTISYGDIAGFLYEMFRGGHWIKLWKELGTHSKYLKYNKKKAAKQIWERLLSSEPKERYAVFQKKTLLKEYSQRQFEEMTRRKKIRTRREYLPLILDPMRFRQIGDNETKLSLRAGILIKDPTRNVELLEWCLRLPSEQYNKNCTNRRLVYEYLSDIMTPEILDQRLPKGRQSADEFYRLEERKGEMFHAMEIMFREHPCPVLDEKKLAKRLEECKELFERRTSTALDRAALEELLYAYEICKLWQIYF